MRRLKSLVFVSISVAASAGCDRDQPAAERERARTAAEPEHVPERLVGVEFARWGEASGHVFFDVAGVTPLPSGYAVFERRPPRVKVLNVDGTVPIDRAVSGEGPGEYRIITSVENLGPDSVAVFDADSRRWTVLSQELEVARTVTLKGHDAPILGTAKLGMGGILVASGSQIVPGTNTLGSARPLHAILLFDMEGQFVREIASVPGPELYFTESGGFVRPPLPRKTVWAGTGQSLYVGTGDAPTIEEFGAAGRGEILLTLPAGDVLPPGRTAAILDSVAASGTSAGRRFRREAEIAGFPSQLPPYEVMVADGDSLLWIGAYRDPSSATRAWRAVDVRSGEIRWLLNLPSAFELYSARGSELAGVWTDRIGREEIVVYQIQVGSEG